MKNGPAWVVVLTAMAAGAVLGALIMLPAVLIGHIGEHSLVKWMIFVPFGAVGGLVTFPLIALLYRIPPRPVAAPAGNAGGK